MSRDAVTETELLRILNASLQSREECADCQFTSVLRLAVERSDGCNWETANLRCSGTPALACQPVARAVVAKVSETHNLLG
jgi:hypothetical protein